MISIEDLILVPLYLIVIFALASLIKSNNIKQYPEYKYFVKGLWFKLIGVSAFISIYLFYYGGGDTTVYFDGAKAVGNLLMQDFSKGLAVLFNTDSYYNSFDSFNYETGYPTHYFTDKNTFLICRLTAPFFLLGSKSFLITSFLTSIFSYIGVWKFYRLVNVLYPGSSKAFAYLVLFMPSLIFWGGGIMKDSFMLGAVCWLTYSFYNVFILRKKVFWNGFFLVLNTFMILNCKPYILICLIPGILLWLNYFYLGSLKNNLIKILVFPLLIVVFLSFGFFIFSSFSSSMGRYGNIDSIIEKAQITQDDLLNELHYGKNNYKLDRIDGSISGLLSSAPLATFTALFRPLPWEIGSPTMVLSAIENTVLLLFVLYSLIRIGPFKFLKIAVSDPFLVYCLFFSLFFAFGVGIAGTNFGALVRYKIPLIPFFFSLIYIIRKKSFI
ncbi:hypothetical protein OAD79_00055 [Flavobacteriales bacterium]|nr:hypothetical protein [Flavobacteriales bacterium]